MNIFLLNAYDIENTFPFARIENPENPQFFPQNALKTHLHSWQSIPKSSFWHQIGVNIINSKYVHVSHSLYISGSRPISMNMFLLNAYDVENMISNLGCDASFLFPFISPLTMVKSPF